MLDTYVQSRLTPSSVSLGQLYVQLSPVAVCNHVIPLGVELGRVQTFGQA